MISDLAARQIELNRSTCDRWQEFSPHRERVMSLLVNRTEGPSRSACILGAGNCNDLDLPALLSTFQSLHLVDLDEAALESGVARQGLARDDRVQLIKGEAGESAGLCELGTEWSPTCCIDDKVLQELAEWPARHFASLGIGQFDVVASTCLLSQLVGGLTRAVSERHPRFLEMVQSIRLGHLRLLARLARPGGRIVLISDFVSSETAPELAEVEDHELGALVGRLLQARNFFTGMNPQIVWGVFQKDEVLAMQLEGVVLHAPWRWNLGPRLYAVYAITGRRKADD